MKTDILSRSIGARVLGARKQSGLSRKALAERADVSERYLVQLEGGDANVSIGVLSRVASALTIDLASLLAPSHDAQSGNVVDAIHAPLADIARRMSLREQKDLVPIVLRYLEAQRRSVRGVALLGLRGAGKTTIGRLFAERHGHSFVSVTREVEKHAGMGLNDLFNLGGPDAYRSLEIEVAKELSNREDRIVLETAGGIVGNGAALEVILKSFKTVWLKASPEEHLERVIRQGDMRPMQGTPRSLEHLKTLLTQREIEYARADWMIDTTGRPPDACVDELESIMAA